MEEETFTKDITICNEDFSRILDFCVNILIKQKIKDVRLGTHWQYMEYNGPMRVYKSKRKNMNQPGLIVKGDKFEIECHLYGWEYIKVCENSIEIDNVGLFFTFKKPIWQQFQKFKQEEKNA